MTQLTILKQIMGMSDTPFYTSHITYQLIIYTIISALQALILQSSVFVNSDFLVIWIWLWLFCWTLIALNIFISSIFTTVKMGNIVGSVSIPPSELCLDSAARFQPPFDLHDDRLRWSATS